jgi:hypothetical protein
LNDTSFCSRLLNINITNGWRRERSIFIPHLLGAVNMISTFEIEERRRDRAMKAAVHRNGTMICTSPRKAMKLLAGRH